MNVNIVDCWSLRVLRCIAVLLTLLLPHTAYAQTATCPEETATDPEGTIITTTCTGDDTAGVTNANVDVGNVLTYGEGQITTTGNNADGIRVVSEGDGDASATNTEEGVIETSGASSRGIAARTETGLAEASNEGRIITTGAGTAHGIHARNTNSAGGARAENTGTIVISSPAVSRVNVPFGVYAETSSGATDRMFELSSGEMLAAGVLAINRGTIITGAAEAHAVYARIAAISGSSLPGIAYALNYGGVRTTGTGSTGVFAVGSAGNAFAINQEGGSVAAPITGTGVYAFSEEADAEARNEEGASIMIMGSSSDTASTTWGVRSEADSGQAKAVNDGQLTIEDTGLGVVYGVYAFSESGGNAEVINNGDVAVDAANARALYAFSQASGADAVVTNGGSVTATGDGALGIWVQGGTGARRLTATNSGTVTVDGDGARGILAFSDNTPVSITNSGCFRPSEATTWHCRRQPAAGESRS